MAPRITPELEFFSVRLPIEFINSRKGQKRLSLQPEQLSDFLELSETDISRLRDCGLILPHPKRTVPKPKIDYDKIAASYRNTMAEMHLESRAELARHLGVSRAWVSRVLKWANRRRP